MAIKQRDRVYRWITECGHFRISLVDASRLANDAIARHNLSGSSAAFLSEALGVTLLAASLLKSDQLVSFKISHPEQGELLATEASRSGEVRGYLQDEKLLALLQDNNGELGRVLIGSTMQLSWWHDRKPRHSYVPIEHGSLAADLNGYFLQSEQIPCFVLQTTQMATESRVELSWAALIQALPDSPADALQTMAQTLRALDLADHITAMLSTKISDPQEFNHKLLPGFDLRELDRYPVDFYCRCSKESFGRSLRTLPDHELLDMAEEGTQEIVCSYCQDHWYYTPDDLRAMVKE
ncbi:MAG: Hsp33 family molecular chaperone HslO [Leptospiraceae bacterium]|nr:Hsp33 family molecular chaperone HslO [Leptospiraceae bacterium]